MIAADTNAIWYANTSDAPVLMSMSVIGPAMKVPAIPQLRKYVALKTPKSLARFFGGMSTDAKAYEDARTMTSEHPLKKLLK